MSDPSENFRQHDIFSSHDNARTVSKSPLINKIKNNRILKKKKVYSYIALYKNSWLRKIIVLHGFPFLSWCICWLLVEPYIFLLDFYLFFYITPFFTDFLLFFSFYLTLWFLYFFILNIQQGYVCV